jgi:hypothetical protein
MGVIQRNPVHDLSEWLEIATRELADPAKERIRLEIEAHHAEAVASHLLEGLSEFKAEKEALAQIGDPDEAANHFRKFHLTVRDAKEAKRAVKNAGSRWMLACGYLLWGALFWLWPFVYRDKPYWNLVVSLAIGFILLVIVRTVGFAMVQRKSRKIGLLFLVQEAGIWIWGLSYVYFMDGFGGKSVFSYLTFICIFYFNTGLRTWLKLLYIADVWDEIPQQNK